MCVCVCVCVKTTAGVTDHASKAVASWIWHQRLRQRLLKVLHLSRSNDICSHTLRCIRQRYLCAVIGACYNRVMWERRCLSTPCMSGLSRECLQHEEESLTAILDCCKSQPDVRPGNGLLTGEPRKGTTASGGLTVTHESCGKVLRVCTKARMQPSVCLAKVGHLT